MDLVGHRGFKTRWCSGFKGWGRDFSSLCAWSLWLDEFEAAVWVNRDERLESVYFVACGDLSCRGPMMCEMVPAAGGDTMFGAGYGHEVV